jgi:hypothetical protein
MQLRISTMANDRKFAKAIRRVLERAQPLVDAFGQMVLEHPIHEAVLIGITDGRGRGYFEEVENRDGFFQVLAGCPYAGDDEALARDVFAIILRSVRSVPFSRPDAAKVDKLIQRTVPDDFHRGPNG